MHIRITFTFLLILCSLQIHLNCFYASEDWTPVHQWTIFHDECNTYGKQNPLRNTVKGESAPGASKVRKQRELNTIFRIRLRLQCLIFNFNVHIIQCNQLWSFLPDSFNLVAFGLHCINPLLLLSLLVNICTHIKIVF